MVLAGDTSEESGCHSNCWRKAGRKGLSTRGVQQDLGLSRDKRRKHPGPPLTEWPPRRRSVIAMFASA